MTVAEAYAAGLALGLCVGYFAGLITGGVAVGLIFWQGLEHLFIAPVMHCLRAFLVRSHGR